MLSKNFIFFFFFFFLKVDEKESERKEIEAMINGFRKLSMKRLCTLNEVVAGSLLDSQKVNLKDVNLKRKIVKKR